eukprot:g7606.t1
MPRRRTIVGLAVLLVGFVVVFLVQPELLRQLSPSSRHQQLRYSGGEATEPPPPAPTPKPTPSPTPPPTPTPFGFDYPLMVAKRTVSSKMRIVFLVGLEGTGHHYLADVLENICKTAEVPCPKVCGVAKALYPGVSIPKSAGDYERARRSLRQELETLATFEEEQLPEGKATMAGFGACRFQAGMMSYPNFNGIEKTLQYVDFRLLAEEAERAGVDVRFVFLTRSARNILVSDTEHNNYGGSFMRESRILLNNAAVVESIFRELDPGFTTCFRYEDMSESSQAARVARFIAPTEYVAQRLEKKMLENVRPRSPTEQQDPNQLRYRMDPWKDPRLADYRDRKFNRAGSEEAAGARGFVPSGNPTKDIVVARLQQKIDHIESGVCLQAVNGSSSDSA